MKRSLIPILLTLAATPSWALAASSPPPSLHGLFSPLLGVADQACKAATGNPLADQLVSQLNLANFCRLVSLARKGYNLEALLRAAGDKALNNAVNGFLSGLAANLNHGGLDELDAWLGDVADAVESGLSYPQAMLEELTGRVYAEAYKLGSGAYDSARVTDDLESQLQGLRPQQDASGVGDPQVRQEVEAYNADRDASARRLAEGAAATGRLAESARAQNTAERAAQAAVEAAQTAVLDQQIAAQDRKAADAAAAGAKVTAPVDPATGKKGLAQQYREDAENAPSDRKLLELNVKALADIMDQQATYMPIIAQILVDQSRQQALTTQFLQQQAGEAAASVVPDGESVARTVANLIEASQAQIAQDIAPTLGALDALCYIYNGNRPCDGATDP